MLVTRSSASVGPARAWEAVEQAWVPCCCLARGEGHLLWNVDGTWEPGASLGCLRTVFDQGGPCTQGAVSPFVHGEAPWPSQGRPRGSLDVPGTTRRLCTPFSAPFPQLPRTCWLFRAGLLTWATPPLQL